MTRRPRSPISAAPAARTARVSAGLMLAAAGLPVGPLGAQSDLTIEVGASRIGTAVDAAGESARFVMAGLRGGHYGAGGSGIFGSVLVGQNIDAATAGGFLSGMLEARLAAEWTPGLEISMDARLLGYGVENPFPYRAFAAEGGPSIRYRASNATMTVSGLAGLGESEITLWRVEGGETRTFTNELWRAGGTAELLLGPPTSQFGLSTGWHNTPSGHYESVGARAVFAASWGIAELRADRWTTPFDSGIVAGLTVMIPIGSAWNLRAFFGRTDPDPLTLAQPGTTSGGALVGRSLLPNGGASESASVVSLVRVTDESTRVRFRVEAPTAATVQVLGDFSLWQPVAMQRSDDVWAVEIDVPVGTHHFGFLVDDEWYLPDDAPDVVPDEWGRDNATLVIEGAS